MLRPHLLAMLRWWLSVHRSARSVAWHSQQAGTLIGDQFEQQEGWIEEVAVMGSAGLAELPKNQGNERVLSKLGS